MQGMSYELPLASAGQAKGEALIGPCSVSERLYQWRKRNNFSQSEAALKLQMSTRTLQEWEQGRAQPPHLALDAVNALIKP
jgi:DNA-binding transcriptional regulator YiaG